jgi:prevent-host-death family protein
MPIIRPISDLRNNFANISKAVHSEDEAIFLTRNDGGDMVVMSIEHYEKQLAKLELYQKLSEAQEEIQAGAVGKDARTILKSMID